MYGMCNKMCSLGAETLRGELDALQVPSAREIYVLLTIHFIIEMSWWTGLAPWELKRLEVDE